MKTPTWVAGLIDGATRAMSFGNTPATPSAPKRPAPAARRSPGPDLKRLAQVHKLEAEGVARFEIARRYGIAQDTVAMLLNLSSASAARPGSVAGSGNATEPDTAEMAGAPTTTAEEAAESAARGTFFRIMQGRITAAGKADKDA